MSECGVLGAFDLEPAVFDPVLTVAIALNSFIQVGFICVVILGCLGVLPSECMSSEQDLVAAGDA